MTTFFKYMKAKKKSNLNFFIDFFEKNNLPNCYNHIEFNNNPNILSLKNDTSTTIEPRNTYQLHLIPNYLELTIRPELKLLQIPQWNNGYGINLKDYKDVDSYVKDQFKKDSKKIFTRLKRLQLCFEIKFVVYNYKITDEEYIILMERLKAMLERRFKQRNDRNENLENWDILYQRTLSLLKDKRASLFVIYDGVKPIQITLLYHMQNILMSAIPAYDIDYVKFGLGNTANYKKVEWCIENGITFIEMGYGDLEYKRKWSNEIYNYNTHIVYNPHRAYSKIYAYLLFIKFSFKEYLKKKGIKESYNKYLSILNRKGKLQNTSGTSICKVEDLIGFPYDEEKTLINIEDEINRFLRKHVYDFQYINFASSQSISVYRSNMIRSSYIITDNKKSRRITF